MFLSPVQAQAVLTKTPDQRGRGHGIPEAHGPLPDDAASPCVGSAMSITVSMNKVWRNTFF